MKNKAWSTEENGILVALYFTMLENALENRPYNKAAMIRAVQAEGLGARSRSSIEAKLMNCSAAHADLHPNAITMADYGYKYAPNYQKALRECVAAFSYQVDHIQYA